jgi:hypothetical protein
MKVLPDVSVLADLDLVEAGFFMVGVAGMVGLGLGGSGSDTDTVRFIHSSG